MKTPPLALAILLAACGTPSADIAPLPDDFAFVSIQLQG